MCGGTGKVQNLYILTWSDIDVPYWNGTSSSSVSSSSVQSSYLTVYGGLGVASCLAFTGGWLSTLLGGLRASALLHNKYPQ